MRAAADNFTMARMLGVRANVVIMAAFAISGMLAAAIGLIGDADGHRRYPDGRVGDAGRVHRDRHRRARKSCRRRRRRIPDRRRQRSYAGRVAARRAAVSRRVRLWRRDRDFARQAKWPVRAQILQTEGVTMSARPLCSRERFRPRSL